MVTSCPLCVCVDMSQPSKYINNVKTKVTICHKAYLQGTINLLHKASSLPTAEYQAVISMLEKCSTSMKYVSSQLAAADNTAKAQQQRIQFLRDLKTPTNAKEDDFVTTILCVYIYIYIAWMLIMLYVMLLCTAAHEQCPWPEESTGIGQKPIGWLVRLQMHQLNWNIVRCAW